MQNLFKHFLIVLAKKKKIRQGLDGFMLRTWILKILAILSWVFVPLTLVNKYHFSFWRIPCCLSFFHRWHQRHRISVDQDVHAAPEHRGQTQRVFHVSHTTPSALKPFIFHSALPSAAWWKQHTLVLCMASFFILTQCFSTLFKTQQHIPQWIKHAVAHHWRKMS